MDLNQIREFVQLAKEEGVHKLKYESKEFKVSVSLAGEGHTVVAQPIAAPAPAAAQAPAAAPKAAESEDFHEIKSPFVGTFYSSPAPDEPTFVNVGDVVSKGQVLCILEAMKIMNEIDSEFSGEVVEVCVENESLVEFGQTLFKIRKS